MRNEVSYLKIRKLKRKCSIQEEMQDINKMIMELLARHLEGVVNECNCKLDSLKESIYKL